MIRKILWLLAALLLSRVQLAEAQQTTKSYRIGFLLVGGSPDTSRRDGFTRGMRELGYAEGKSYTLEYRRAGGQVEVLNDLATELVRLGVDVIVTSGTSTIRAAMQATDRIPIVMTIPGDPVASGFVGSLAQPGGNVTGLSTQSPQLAGKRLELLREILPNANSVVVMASPADKGNELSWRETEAAAAAFKVRLIRDSVEEVKSIGAHFVDARKARAEAVLILPDPILLFHRTQVVEAAAKSGLPVFYDAKEYVHAGGLISYGPDHIDLFRRAAIYVDKILKGAKPANLPVEQPTKFELLINLKTAKQIGLTIPPNVLARADRVIK